MNKFYYRVKPDVALSLYSKNGMTLEFNPMLMNGYLLIEAFDEATADQIRRTFTDIDMWERIYDPATQSGPQA